MSDIKTTKALYEDIECLVGDYAIIYDDMHGVTYSSAHEGVAHAQEELIEEVSAEFTGADGIYNLHHKLWEFLHDEDWPRMNALLNKLHVKNMMAMAEMVQYQYVIEKLQTTLEEYYLKKDE